MRETILSYVISRDLKGLQDFLRNPANEQRLLNFFSLEDHGELINTVFFEHLAPADATDSPDEKIIEQILKTLCAYGANNTINPEIIYAFRCTEIVKCHLINFFNHELKNIASCILDQTVSMLKKEELAGYTHYCLSHPILKTLLNQERVKKTMEQYRLFLNTIDQHITHRTLFQYYKDAIQNNIQSFKDFCGDSSNTLYPLLSECACGCHKRDVREKLEAIMLHEATTRYPVARTSVLNYVSMGAGNLLQDFIIIFKLIESGYKHINISLIEPCLDDPTYEQFKRLYDIAIERGAELNIQKFSHVSDYSRVKSAEKIHLINGIDFESVFKRNTFSDVMAIQSLLDEEGFFLFTYETNKFAIQKNSLKPIFFEVDRANKYLNKFFAAIATDAVFKQDTVRMAMPDAFMQMDQWTQLLPTLKSCPFRAIELTLVAPPKYDYFGGTTAEKNPGFTKENLERFLSLCLGGGKTVTVHLVDSKAEMMAVPFRQDIIYDLSVRSDNIDTLYQQIEADKLRYSPASYYLLAEHRKPDRFRLPVVTGHVSTMLNKDIFKEKLVRVETFENALISFVARIKTDITGYRTTAGCFHFFNRNITKADKLERALSRILSSGAIMDYMDEVAEPSIEEAVRRLVFTKINGEESLHEAYNFHRLTNRTNETGSHREIMAFAAAIPAIPTSLRV